MNQSTHAGRVVGNRPAIEIERSQKHSGGKSDEATLLCSVVINVGPVKLRALASTAGVTPISDRYGRVTWTYSSPDAHREIEDEVLRAVRHLATTRGIPTHAEKEGRYA